MPFQPSQAQNSPPRPALSGRALLVLLSLCCLGLFGLCLAAFGPRATWGALGIPSHHPSFIDLRGVLSGLDAARQGFDPLRENPLDPYLRPVVYPRLWLALGWLGLGADQTVPVAILILGLYAAAIWVGLRGYSRQTAVWLALVIFSPASMMAYLFGNLDLVIFSLLGLALALEPFSAGWLLGLVELAAFLKYFPIVALGYFLKAERRVFLRQLLIGGAIFALYLALTWSDTSWILAQAPKGALENYGAGVIGFRVYELSASRAAAGYFMLPAWLALYVLLVLVLYWSSRFQAAPAAPDDQFLDAFRTGALIYLATFLQGNSFNYRLIFLILAVPQIVAWFQMRPELRFAAGAALGCLLATCWGMALNAIIPPGAAFVLDEAANWLLFAMLEYLFLISAPTWLRTEIAAFFQKYRKG